MSPAATTHDPGFAYALDELFARAKEYRRSDEYLELLRFVCRFPTYKPYNGFLIRLQNPRARYVASAYQWQRRFGRAVRAAARPVLILVPFGPVGIVYDLDDTDGPPLPIDLEAPFRTSGTVSPVALENLATHCEERRIPLRTAPLSRFHAGRAIATQQTLFPPADDVAPGCRSFRPDRFEIVLNDQLSMASTFATFVHELAHLHCGHLGRRRLGDREDRWDDRLHLPGDLMEVEAESVAFLVCARWGVTTSSEAYLAAFVRSCPELPPISVATVLRVAGEVDDMARRPPRKPKEEGRAVRRREPAPEPELD